MTFVATSDVVLSLPSPKQLEAGEFDLDELVRKLTEALTDDSQRNEILRLTGDVAVLVIECLDKVSEIESRSWMPGLYHALGYLVRRLQGHSRCSSTLKSVLHDLETSRNCQYLPRSYWINPAAIALENLPYTRGPCAEVYTGTHEGKAVAVKVLRTSDQESVAKLKKVCGAGGKTRGRD